MLIDDSVASASKMKEAVSTFSVFFSRITFFALLVCTGLPLLWGGSQVLNPNEYAGSGLYYVFFVIPGALLAIFLGSLASFWTTVDYLLEWRNLKVIVQIAFVVAVFVFLPSLLIIFPAALTTVLYVFYYAGMLLMFVGWVSRSFLRRDPQGLRPRINRDVSTWFSPPLFGMAIAAISAAATMITVTVQNPGNSYVHFPLLLPLWLFYGAVSGFAAQRVWQLVQKTTWPTLAAALASGLAAALAGVLSAAAHVSMVLSISYLQAAIVSACVLFAVFTLHALLLGRRYPVPNQAQDTINPQQPSSTTQESTINNFLTQRTPSED